MAQVWFAYATTELMIILARMFAGLFTGGIFVSFLTYIVNKSDPEDQGKYLTYSATIKSVASAFGYMIGGFFRRVFRASGVLSPGGNPDRGGNCFLPYL